ncbi:MAG: beta-propeller fold lactonase family protein [Thiotrichaceae bacterium]|nr:beta-propeller fold lactonase family protein [Thiotrichaceae bacterium]
MHRIVRSTITSLLLFCCLSPSFAATTLPLVDTQIEGNNVTGMSGANSVAVNHADGQYVYVSAYASNAIVTFKKDPSSEKLVFVESITNTQIGGVGLQKPSSVVVSPDDRHVYVAGTGDNAISVFTRNSSNGKLSLVQVQRNNVNGITGLNGVNSLSISSDNTRLYATGSVDSTIAVFSRNATTGELSLLTTQSNGVGGVLNMLNPVGVLVSKDNFIYVASFTGNAISVFSRNASNANPEWTFLAEYVDSAGTVKNLQGAYSLALSPDEKQLYVASNLSSAITVFNKSSNGLLSYAASYVNGTTIKGLAGVRGVAVNPSGNEVYAASIDDNSVVVFKRSTDGTLTFSQQVSAASVPSVTGANALNVSDDGVNLYVTALSGSALSKFNLVSSDLSVAVTDNAPVAVSGNLTYTVKVTNLGSNQASNIVLTDTLPPEATFVSATSTLGTCAAPVSGVLTCSLGNLATNGIISVTVIVKAPATVGAGTLVNKAVVSSTQYDPDNSNNAKQTSSVLQQSVPTADLTLTAQASATTLNVGTAFSYTVGVSNAGPDAASQVIITSILPAEVTVDSAKFPSTCTYTASTRSLACTLPSIALGQSGSVTIPVTAPATAGTIVFNTSVANAAERNSTAVTTASVSTQILDIGASLTLLDATASPTSISLNTNAAISINVKNAGTSTASGVTLLVTLPSSLSFDSGTGCTASGSNVSCTLADIAANATLQTTFTVKGTVSGSNQPLASSLSIAGKEVVSSSLPLTLNVTGDYADIALLVQPDTASILLGSKASYTLTVTNNGFNQAAVAVSGSISGSSAFAVGSFTVSKGTCVAGSSFTCQLDIMPSGTSNTIKIEVSPTSLGALSLTATATGEMYDPVSVNNSGTASISVANTTADLVVTTTTLPKDTVLMGSNLVYTNVVNNAGPNNATAVKFAQTLPSNVSFVSANSGQGTPCSFASNTVSCDLGNITSGLSSSVVTTVTPLGAGSLVTGIAVTGAVFDPKPENSNISVTTTVTKANADVKLTLSASPEPVLVSNLLTYLLTITNAGPDTASNISVSDILPANTVYMSNTVTPAGQASCANDATNTFKCTVPSLTKDASVAIQLVVQPTLAGTISNTASISAAAIPTTSTTQASVSSRVNKPAALVFVEAQKSGVNGVSGLQQVNALAATSDGKFLYAASLGDNSVEVFARNASDGKLSLVQVLSNNIDGITGLAGASGLGLSPDNKFLYVTAYSDKTVNVFQRDTATGKLSFVETQRTSANLAGAFAVVAASNSVYVASTDDNSISVFSRDQNTGKLTFVETQKDNVGAVKGLTGTSGLALSSDEKFLVAAGTKASSLVTFTRDTSSGKLTFVQTLVNGAGAVQGLDSVINLAISSDNKFVYAIGGGADNAVAVFAKGSDGLLSFVEVQRNGSNGVTGLVGAYGIALTPDNAYVYVTAMSDNALSIFSRNASSGKLSYVGSVLNGSGGVSGMTGARPVVSSSSGAQVYVGGFSDAAIAVLRMTGADLAVSATGGILPVRVGDQVSYVQTVTNLGLDQATNVTLTYTLPAELTLVSATPAKGNCNTVNNTVTCGLQVLNLNESASVTFVVTASRLGSFSQTVKASADQPDQNTANNSLNLILSSAATADLGATVSMTSASPAVIKNPLTYTVNLSNTGPDTAATVKVVATFPALLSFSTASVDNNSSACALVDKVVTCTVGSLTKGQTSNVIFTGLPSNIGTVNTTFDITTESVDPTPTARLSMRTTVQLNTLDSSYDNTNKTLYNYNITSTGSVTGGTLSGDNTSQGTVSNVVIAANSSLTGGKVSGAIVNNGTLQDVQLLNATVTGSGSLKGRIAGIAGSPATVSGKFEAGARLSDIIIGAGSTLDPSVQLLSNVRFASNDLIPAGIDLNTVLPYLSDVVTGLSVANLSFDVVVGGDNLIQSINAIPELKTNSLTYTQVATGQMLLSQTTQHQVLFPSDIRQATATQTVGITYNPDGSVLFITPNRRAITAQPALENTSALQTELTAFGIKSFKVLGSGMINIPLSSVSYLALRPDALSSSIDNATASGVVPMAVPTLAGATQFALRYLDSSNNMRQQLVYASPAYPDELRLVLKGIPDASNILFYNNGSISMKIGTKTYNAFCDYTVKIGGVGSQFPQLGIVADQNGDGGQDVRITYANGDQQVIYLVPEPSWIEEVRNLPEIQQLGAQVSQDSLGNLVLLIGSNRYSFGSAQITQLSTVSKAQAVLNADGSASFTTASNRLIVAQPVAQSLSLLNSEVVKLGLAAPTWQANVGNFLLAVAPQKNMVVRADAVALAMPNAGNTGLSTGNALVNGVNTVLLTFFDENQVKRQQAFYPAPRDPVALAKFFSNAPNVNTVTFSNDGSITINTSQYQLKGVIDYWVETGGIATGSLQVTPTADMNGDGTPDLMVVYGNGDKQMIYQRP